MAGKPLEAMVPLAPGGLEGAVGSLLWPAPDAHALLVLAHGAGAGMHHAFMAAVCESLAARGVSTLRYEFPYMAAGRRAPDRAPKLQACVRAAIAYAQQTTGEQPLFAAGKSMGGRMSSLALAAEPVEAIAGVVFLGFPLHAAGKVGSERADHLRALDTPMLFVQGTRDKLAPLDELEPVVAALGARAEIHVVEGGDHSFHVLKRSGRSDDEVLDEIAERVAEWTRAIAEASG